MDANGVVTGEHASFFPIVLDEPTSSLDMLIQAQILELLRDIRSQFPFTCLLISHDVSAVRYLSDRILVMQSGSIVDKCLCEQLFGPDREAYTRRLVAPFA